MCGRTNWNFSFTSLKNKLEHLDTRSLEYEGEVSTLCWSTGCGVFGTLLWGPSLFLSWGVPHGWCLSQSGKRQGYTYYPCLKLLGTFLFDLYKFSRTDQNFRKRQDWCFLTVWLEGTGHDLDLGLDAWLFLVWIWGPSAVSGGAQVWLIVFSWGVCEPGPMIGLAKKWILFWWFLFPSWMSGAPAGCVVVVH